MSSSKHPHECVTEPGYHKSRNRRQRRSPLSSLSRQILSKPSPSSSPSLPSFHAISNSYCFPAEIPTWPSSGLTKHTKLSHNEALAHICKGAIGFEGYTVRNRHATTGRHWFYARAGNDESDEDGARELSSAMANMTLSLEVSNSAPDETVEQPRMIKLYGRLPGTISLNHWVSTSAASFKLNPCDYTRAADRDLDTSWIIRRLGVIQEGLETDDSERYDYFYSYIIFDPGRYDGLAGEIKSLATVLQAEKWIDFGQRSNQIIADYLSTEDSELASLFYHQLLLSVELYLRLNLGSLGNEEKHEILINFAPRVSWTIALASRWLENVWIEIYDEDDDTPPYQFNFRNKSRQIALLQDFASEIKWPHIRQVEECLGNTDNEGSPIELKSFYSLSWTSGLILPGPSAPWLLMQCLIDVDDDAATKLARLDHLYPNTGFQYLDNSYWASDCIVGKILGAAKGVKEVNGWIGPCMPTPDLARTQLIRIRQTHVSHRMHINDIRTISERTAPLGPPYKYYRVKEYVLPLPNRTSYTDNIRIEKLAFLPWTKGDTEKEPDTYNAAVVFAIDGESWPVRLRFDVSFISAPPCHSGPHPLFYDYAHNFVRPDELLDIHEWAGASLDLGLTHLSSANKSSLDSEPFVEDPKEVLVVETFGNADLEIFARAWCSHMGLSAIVVEVDQTCVTCAVRGAYAVCVSVVVLR